jgi:hypothetical protein
MQGFHKWLQGKKARKEPIPETRDEMMQMYRVDRPAFLFPRKHQGSMRRHQIKYAFRRHHT